MTKKNEVEKCPRCGKDHRHSNVHIDIHGAYRVIKNCQACDLLWQGGNVFYLEDGDVCPMCKSGIVYCDGDILIKIKSKDHVYHVCPGPRNDRVITVVLKVKDPEIASMIWKAHGEKKNMAGCEILGIADGDYLQTVDDPESGTEE